MQKYAIVTGRLGVDQHHFHGPFDDEGEALQFASGLVGVWDIIVLEVPVEAQIVAAARTVKVEQYEAWRAAWQGVSKENELFRDLVSDVVIDFMANAGFHLSDEPRDLNDQTVLIQSAMEVGYLLAVKRLSSPEV